MFKLLKRLFLVLLFGLVLVVVLGAIFAYQFDANDYKTQITSYVEEKSNRSVELATLNLSLFPSLALNATELKIGENPTFGDGYFLEAEEIQLGLKLLPLLKQEAQVDGIKLKGIKLRILQNVRGQFNFDDLKALATTNQNTDSDTMTNGTFGALALTGFGGVVLEEGYLLWDDQLNATRAVASDLNFESGSLSPDAPFPVSLRAIIKLSSGDLEDLIADTVLNAEVLPDLPKGGARIDDINMRMELTQSDKPLVARINGQATALEFSGGVLSANQIIPIELDANVSGLSEDIEALGATLRMQAEMLPNPSANTIQINNLVTEARMKGLDEDLNLQLTAENNQALLEGKFVVDRFGISYGDIQVAGRVKFTNLYQNPQADIAIPVFDYDVWQFERILLRSSKIDNRILLNLQQADFHQGQISGNADVDLTSDSYRMKLSADSIPIDKIQVAFSEDRRATVRGQAQLNLALTGAMGDFNKLLQSSDGEMKVHIRQGALQDESLAAIIERVAAFLEGRPRRAAGEELIFDDMRASVLLNKGIAKNNDLTVRMPLLDVKGAGQVDLVRSRIDYMLRTRLKSIEQIQIPIRISGDLQSPDYGPDYGQLINYELLNKSKLKEKLEEKVTDVEQKIKDKIEDKLLDGLKDKLKLPF